MAFSRYKKIRTVFNDTDEHFDLYSRRDRNFIRHHRSVKTKEVSEASASQIVHKFHIWQQSDRYWKLSNKYYGDPEYWWVIARYNQSPTESHLQNGDTIMIPFPLQSVLRALGY